MSKIFPIFLYMLSEVIEVDLKCALLENTSEIFNKIFPKISRIILENFEN